MVSTGEPDELVRYLEMLADIEGGSGHANRVLTEIRRLRREVERLTPVTGRQDSIDYINEVDELRSDAEVWKRKVIDLEDRVVSLGESLEYCNEQRNELRSQLDNAASGAGALADEVVTLQEQNRIMRSQLDAALAKLKERENDE